jgi:hypothetical protein
MIWAGMTGFDSDLKQLRYARPGSTLPPNGYRQQSGGIIKLTTHFYSVPMLRIRGAALHYLHGVVLFRKNDFDLLFTLPYDIDFLQKRIVNIWLRKCLPPSKPGNHYYCLKDHRWNLF